METNNQNNIENNVQETTGTYKDLEKKAPPKEKRLGVWGSMWGILTDQVELIAYIDERIDTRASALIDEKVVAIANTDIDEAFKQDAVEKNTVNTTEQTTSDEQNAEVQPIRSSQLIQPTRKKRIVVVS